MKATTVHNSTACFTPDASRVASKCTSVGAASPGETLATQYASGVKRASILDDGFPGRSVTTLGRWRLEKRLPSNQSWIVFFFLDVGRCVARVYFTSKKGMVHGGGGLLPWRRRGLSVAVVTPTAVRVVAVATGYHVKVVFRKRHFNF